MSPNNRVGLFLAVIIVFQWGHQILLQQPPLPHLSRYSHFSSNSHSICCYSTSGGGEILSSPFFLNPKTPNTLPPSISFPLNIFHTRSFINCWLAICQNGNVYMANLARVLKWVLDWYTLPFWTYQARSLYY